MDPDITRFSKASDVDLPTGSKDLTRSYFGNFLYTEAHFLCQWEHCVHCNDKRVNFIYGNNGRTVLPSHAAHEWNEWQSVGIMNVKNGEVNRLILWTPDETKLCLSCIPNLQVIRVGMHVQVCINTNTGTQPASNNWSERVSSRHKKM
jgi:hypothetical protein